MEKTAGVDLIAAHWLLAGQRPSANPHPCPMPLRDRALLAAEAGYAGIGLLASELEAEVARHGTSGVRALLEDAGIRHVELEALTDWWRDENIWRGNLERMIAFGGAIGARLIKATGDFSADPCALAAMSDAFALVAEIARQGGMPVALEVIAFSNIADIAAAHMVLGDQLGKGAGLMLDSWHVARCGLSLDSISALPQGVIIGVEISDIGPAIVGDMFTDTLDHRRVPGEGVYPLSPFLDAVAQTGYSGPVGLEVLSASLRSEGVPTALVRCAEAARKILAECH
ncbi:sugar phosphate isomerase/epimerase (plasmid) [Sphingobium sp. SJ10-10]|uniref:sugar phosphate isomerase/epimerase family protein n=1 Tax=Sphingobium sp. SJ10-10 TaxID=3114999 RepID=UPI002E19EB49|nr:sugar phosphate isomerase/epimerase [Sphingobium sp. SJ10-10]